MKNNDEIDYGFLSDVSKDLNCNLLGDCAGSTISRRTTRGFKKSFGLDNNTITDQNAEHIIHAAMLGVVTCFSSRTEKATIGGILMLAGLIYFYQKGDRDNRYLGSVVNM